MVNFRTVCFHICGLILMCHLAKLPVCAEEPSSEKNIEFVSIVDTYAAYDTNRPYTSARPYTTQALHDGEVRLNLATVGVRASNPSFRGGLVMQAGDSVEANYAAEQKLFWRYIQELNGGMLLSKKLWLDAGIYPAHVGFESFSSSDNWNYTRSLVAEFSPYYQTGFRASYQLTDHLAVSSHLVRGWQNISSAAEPLYGISVVFSPDSGTRISYGGLVGHSQGGYRSFQDLVFRRDLTDRWSIAGQYDLGTQGRDQDAHAVWHGFALLSRYQISPEWFIGSRVERFDDSGKVIVPTLSGESFRVSGVSLNVDRILGSGFVWRTEYRIAISGNRIFPEDREGRFSADSGLIVTSLSYSFPRSP